MPALHPRFGYPITADPRKVLGRPLGYIPDKPDPRDYMLTRMPYDKAKMLPPRIDYTSKMSPVGDQGNEGTCVGWAAADGMKEYQEGKEWGKDVQLSPRYVYENARKLDPPAEREDEGTTIRSAMKVLNKKGVCPEDCWNYVPKQPGFPTDDADEKAGKYKIVKYSRLEDLDAYKESLVVNGPFVAGVLVFQSWADVTGNGIVPMPDPKRPGFLGGHAICIVGFDETKRLMKFKNSWGPKWGDSGYGYLSYDYIGMYCIDAWSARDLVFERV